jgi:hypothetical protein
MVELEIEMKKKFGEWVEIKEDGSKLKKMYG